MATGIFPPFSKLYHEVRAEKRVPRLSKILISTIATVIDDAEDSLLSVFD